MEITIEFVGGPMDGAITFQEPKENQALNADVLLAWGYYRLTNGGQVGMAAMGASPAALELLRTRGGQEAAQSGAKPHRYRVIDRREKPGKVFVRAEVFDDADRDGGSIVPK